MKSLLSKQFLVGLRQERGSFTLESTFIFPLLLFLIFAFLLFSMMIYQKVVLYYSAAITAERASFSWDNSYRNPRNGMLTDRQYDGLYWRLSDDYLVGSLLGLDQAASGIKLAIPGLEEEQGLAQRKLFSASQWIGHAEKQPFTGDIQYDRRVLSKAIQVRLKQPLTIEPLQKLLGVGEPASAARAAIVDPVEFIRSLDTVRYYSLKLANSNNVSYKEQASQVLLSYANRSTKKSSK